MMMKRRLRDLGERLQGKKPHMPHFLTEVHLDGIRGIDNLRVEFDYPVSVIAGGNASGKSTVLFAAACAYKGPEAGTEDFVPSTLFPSYSPDLPGRKDAIGEVILDYEYSTPEGRQTMRWERRSEEWALVPLRRKNKSQPEREVYLRTLSNLANPTEVRGILNMSRLSSLPYEQSLTLSQIEFAQQILPIRYSEVVDLSDGGTNLLFAAQERGATYSELHMAAGERAILRLAQEVAHLQDALVLIDEVEAGLHPWVQQLLMLQLQQLALRNDLQIIVATHSPVVLDSVPYRGRILLDRDEKTGKVTVQPSYRDMVQDALYGRSDDTLNLLCEDDAAEGLLRGVIDYLSINQRIRSEAIRIGRNTGANEFHTHAAAFRKFGQIENFVFILDGDKRHTNIEQRIRGAAENQAVPVAFLPGYRAPEEWTWQKLDGHQEEYAEELNIDSRHLSTLMQRQNSTYDSASDGPSEIAKFKLRGLAADLNRSSPDICRVVGHRESRSGANDIQPLVQSLGDALLKWREAKGE